MYSALALSGDADDVAQARFRFEPPEQRSPLHVGVSGVIGRSADVAILLVGLTRYTTGLQIASWPSGVVSTLTPEDRMHSSADAGCWSEWNSRMAVPWSPGTTADSGRRHTTGAHCNNTLCAWADSNCRHPL